MLRTYPTLLFLCLFIQLSPQITEAQQSKSRPAAKPKPVNPPKNPYLGNLVPKDYKYYFVGIYNKQYWDYIAPNNTPYYPVIDVRTFKPVNIWFQSAEKGRLMPDSSILRVLHDHYDHTGRIASISTTGALKYFATIEHDGVGISVHLSPDSKQGVFVKNNDIWKADFDYKSGKLSNHKQVTQLGLFSGTFVWNWYENAIAIGDYLVNLADGNVINLHEKFQFNAVDYMKDHVGYKEYISPNSRWAKFEYNYDNGEKITIFDFKNFRFNDLKLTKLVSNVFLWISDDRFLLNVLQKNPSDNYDHTVMVANGNFAVSPQVTSIKDLNEIMSVDGNWASFKSHPSPKMENIIFLRPRGSFEEKIIVLNTKTFEKKQLNFLWPSGELNFFDFRNSVHWVDETHIVFSQYNGQVTVSEQGTYWMDITTGEKKKLTSYTLPQYAKYASVISLPEVDKILFNANGYLFKCNMDGSAVEQVTKEPEEILVVSAFQNTFR